MQLTKPNADSSWIFHFDELHKLVDPWFTAVINQADIERELNLNPFDEGVCMMFGCGIPDYMKKR
jgi:hypothetical protein